MIKSNTSHIGFEDTKCPMGVEAVLWVPGQGRAGRTDSTASVRGAAEHHDTGPGRATCGEHTSERS